MFNEKTVEHTKDGDKPVWQSPKYIAAKEKAIEAINSGKYGLAEADFWILMNLTAKKDKMAYSGLIISHNGCLKINDCLESKFTPSCVFFDKDGYKNSLVYSYCNDEQGIYEVGEVSDKNCSNAYPYAMAYKRLFDRVVLKLSKFAYSGIMSDSESEEFVQPETETNATSPSRSKFKPNVYDTFSADPDVKAMQEEVIALCKGSVDLANKAAKKNYGADVWNMTREQLNTTLDKLNAKGA